jgi:hypothetical protein
MGGRNRRTRVSTCLRRLRPKLRSAAPAADGREACAAPWSRGHAPPPVRWAKRGALVGALQQAEEEGDGDQRDGSEADDGARADLQHDELVRKHGDQAELWSSTQPTHAW